MGKLVEDLSKYIREIETEVERKSNSAGVNVFFDYSVKFISGGMVPTLEQYLDDKGYRDIELRGCHLGNYDIIFYW